MFAVFSVALVSPGPDFVMAVRNSLVHSRRAGIFTALGFGVGVLFHVSYVVLGLAAVIAGSGVLFSLIKYAGAAYLAWMGLRALRSQGIKSSALDAALAAEPARRPFGDIAAFRSGFLTNALNPKVTLFFLAIFSQVIQPGTPALWQAAYGLTCSVMTVAWFSGVAVLLTNARMRQRFAAAAQWIDRTCGALMLTLAVRVVWSVR